MNHSIFGRAAIKENRDFSVVFLIQSHDLFSEGFLNSSASSLQP